MNWVFVELTVLLQAKHALNVGTFDSSQFNNPQLYAHLIKLWFRDLPDSVLQHVHEEELILCKQLPACLKIVESIPPEFRTIFDWLLELMSEVVDCSDVNFMNPANLGIVMGPNLLPNVDAANPMQALMLNKVRLICSLPGLVFLWFTFVTPTLCRHAQHS